MEMSDPVKMYEVVVRVTITKTYTVLADSKDQAIDDVFDAGVDIHNEADVPEDYNEEVLSVTEIHQFAEA